MIPDVSARPFRFLCHDGHEEADLIGRGEMAAMWHSCAAGPRCPAEAGEEAAAIMQWDAEYLPDCQTYGPAHVSDEARAYLRKGAR